MQYRCSKRFVILSKTRMRRTRVTPLRYLAATDASGGVARQQKITHAHAQFPHPFAITYGGKKYIRILPFFISVKWKLLSFKFQNTIKIRITIIRDDEAM
jgi:hypothetical protein